jgi:ABC-type transporter MlaC component
MLFNRAFISSFVLFILTFLSWNSTAAANPQAYLTASEELADEILSSARTIRENPNLEDRARVIGELLPRYMDLPTLAAHSLGRFARDYRENRELMTRFTEALRASLAKRLAANLASNYSLASFNRPNRAVAFADGIIHVRIRQTGEAGIQGTLVFMPSSDGRRMVLSDMQAFNASMSLAYRTQHIEFLNKPGNNLEGLIQSHISSASQNQPSRNGF